MTKIPCFVFDVDGTIANIAHRVHLVQQRPKNWPKFLSLWQGDTAYPDIVFLFQTLQRSGIPVFIVSARKEKEREYTLQQFAEWGIEGWNAFYLRPDKDNRKDSLFKKDILDKIRADGYEPVCIFDDRQDVVDMWRANGLTCAQVRAYDW